VSGRADQPARPAGLVIRPYAEADHDAVRELWCSAWEATYPAIDFRARWPLMLTRWRGMAGGIHLAVRDGAVAGMIVLDRTDLDQIAVAPALFGSPVAAALMDFAKALAGERLTLTVNASNARAIRFYERHGFVPTGTGVSPLSGLPTRIYQWRHRAVNIANNS